MAPPPLARGARLLGRCQWVSRQEARNRLRDRRGILSYAVDPEVEAATRESAAALAEAGAAVSVPVGRSSESLPTGPQIDARRSRDDEPLRIGAVLERIPTPEQPARTAKVLKFPASSAIVMPQVSSSRG